MAFTRENMTDDVIQLFNELFEQAESLMYSTPEHREAWFEDMAFTVRELQKVREREEQEHGFVG